MTLEGLILKRCRGSAAVVVRRAQGPIQNDLTLERVAFFGNDNDDLGGGLRVDGCCGEDLIRVEMRYCAFRRNIANSGAAIGGSHLELDVRHSRFVDNVARRGHGGAIFANESDLALASSRFVKNEAAASGGGIYLTGIEARLDVSTTIFKRNECGKELRDIHFSSEVYSAVFCRPLFLDVFEFRRLSLVELLRCIQLVRLHCENAFSERMPQFVAVR